MASVLAAIEQVGVDLHRQLILPPVGSSGWSDCTEDACAGVDEVVVVGPREFQDLPWELLRASVSSRPFALSVPVTRQLAAGDTAGEPGAVGPLQEIVLCVARPFGSADIGHRSVAGPLAALIADQAAHCRLSVVRPGTFRALEDHLSRARDRLSEGARFAVHFDVHGIVATSKEIVQGVRRGIYRGAPTPDGDETNRTVAYLLFESSGERGAHPVPDTAVVGLLERSPCPAVIVLNACESAAAGASLAYDLASTVTPTVVAMTYKVTESAVDLVLPALYSRLLRGGCASRGLLAARQALHGERLRRTGRGGTAELDDWMIPIVLERWAPRSRPRPAVEPKPSSSVMPRLPPLLGRESDIARIERLLGETPRVLLRGMIGAGKTALLDHLEQWWTATGFASRLHRVDLATWDTAVEGLRRMTAHPAWNALDDGGPSAVVLFDHVDAARHGAASWPMTSLREFRDFVAGLAERGCRCLVAARGDAVWLLGEHVVRHELAPLGTDDLAQLFNLDQDELSPQRTASLLGLPAAALALASGHGSTESAAPWRKAVALAWEQFEPETRRTVEILAPFQGSVPFPLVEPYAALVAAEGVDTALFATPALRELEQTGTGRPCTRDSGFATLHPFLLEIARQQLAEPEWRALCRAHARLFGETSLWPVMTGKELGNRRTARNIAVREEANVTAALLTALREREQWWKGCLAVVTDVRRRTGRTAELPELADHIIDAASDGELPPDREALACGMDLKAHCLLDAWRLDEAARQYEAALREARFLGDNDLAAGAEQQLGLIAQRQSRFDDASRHYRSALNLRSEAGWRAQSHHQLGRLAQDQDKLNEARRWFERAVDGFDRAGDDEAASSSRYQLGMVVRRLGDSRRAEELFTEALQTRNGLRDPEQRGNCHNELARLAHEHGDDDRAERQVRQALLRFEEAGQETGQAKALMRLSEIVASRRPDEAAHLLALCVTHADRTLEPRLRKAAHERLARALSGQRRYAEAADHTLAALIGAGMLPGELPTVDLSWINDQRAGLGDEEFHAVARRRLGEKRAAQLVAELDRLVQGRRKGYQRMLDGNDSRDS
ncbi:tetratricopeptide repeat protein [Streptomyces sp. ODS28]|uniref:tetratricopeptide repeat protein n=1 Tax=Streptomyces sp. ODS28 TaxID=3136688 RepID=UPI0031F1217C